MKVTRLCILLRLPPSSEILLFHPIEPESHSPARRTLRPRWVGFGPRGLRSPLGRKAPGVVLELARPSPAACLLASCGTAHVPAPGAGVARYWGCGFGMPRSTCRYPASGWVQFVSYRTEAVFLVKFYSAVPAGASVPVSCGVDFVTSPVDAARQNPCSALLF